MSPEEPKGVDIACGQTVNVACMGRCLRVFDLTLEPGKGEMGWPSQELLVCPFCGSEKLDVESSTGEKLMGYVCSDGSMPRPPR
jgi:hypothetical protein